MIFGRAEGDFAASYDLKSPDVVDGKTATSFLGLRAEDALGVGVGSAGDLNGDGVADVWVRKLGKRKKKKKKQCDRHTYMYVGKIRLVPPRAPNTMIMLWVCPQQHTPV